jgi:hypothetical protein
MNFKRQVKYTAVELLTYLYKVFCFHSPWDLFKGFIVLKYFSSSNFEILNYITA